MGNQRATCPYCGKFTLEMYYSETTLHRALVCCAHCGKTFYVVYGNGTVKGER